MFFILFNFYLFIYFSIKNESEFESARKKVEDQVEEVVAQEMLSTKEEIVIKENEAISEQIEAPTESAGFLRIESVVSLNDVEDDSLDPVSSINLHSNVTVAKEEVKFPYSTNHDRCKFAAKLKDAEIYKTMLDSVRVRCLFKCMAYRCIFSSDSAKDFRQHLQWHNKHFLATNPSEPVFEHRMLSRAVTACETLTFPDFNFCCYCPFVAYSTVELVEHIEGIHASSEFQCSACFFRARRSKIIDIHTIICHAGTNAHALTCKTIVTSGSSSVMDEMALTQVPRYRCCVDKCTFACILDDSFIEHMSGSHPELKHLRCRLCTEPIACNDNDYAGIFHHMSTHNIGYFQCAFCLWGSNLPTDFLIHQCLHHPSVQGKVLIRSSQTAAPNTTLSEYWKPGLPSTYSQTHKIDFDRRFRELFEKVQVMESPLVPEEDVQVISEVENSHQKAIEEQMNVPSNVGEGDTVSEEGSSSNPSTIKESETEFHGFGEEELAKSKEQTESIAIVSDAEDENSASSFNEVSAATAIQANEESADQELEDHQEGLSGRQLYVCGNIGCDETAETAATFKVREIH